MLVCLGFELDNFYQFEFTCKLRVINARLNSLKLRNRKLTPTNLNLVLNKKGTENQSLAKFLFYNSYTRSIISEEAPPPPLQIAARPYFPLF